MSNANSDHKKVMRIHDWVCNNIEYEGRDEGDSKDHHGDIYGAFIEGKAVCSGYMQAFTLLCHRYSLDCVGVIGSTSTSKDGTGHAWNMVKVDGEWYFVDTTWDDRSWGIGYQYFLIGSGTKTDYGYFAYQDHMAESLYGMTPSIVAHQLKSLGVPSARSLTYNGMEQSAFNSYAGFFAVGNTGKNAGSYVATLVPQPEYMWSDGTFDTKYVSWSISKSTLIARYEGETIDKGDIPALIVTVSGFVNGENETTASGYVKPTISSYDPDPGSHVLRPSGGYADNYEFDYRSGVLKVEGEMLSVQAVVTVIVVLAAAAIAVVLFFSRRRESKNVTCPCCGHKLSKGDKFCPQCGQMLRR